MNRSVRTGLVVLCVAGVLALVWLVVNPGEVPPIRDGFDQKSAADMFRGLAVVSAVVGLVLIAKGLLRD